MSRPYFDRVLIAALKRAHRELDRHGISVQNCRIDLLSASGFRDPYRRRIVGLAFLAPDIQAAILAGRQPPGLTLKRLTRREIPLNWAEQQVLFCVSPAE